MEAQQSGPETVGAWSKHCVDVVFPALRSGRNQRYDEDTLKGFRVIVHSYIAPRIGKTRVIELSKAMVVEFMAALPSDEARTKTLYVLTRIMELAETKGKRRKGTNPCKGVRLDHVSPPEPKSPARPDDWRDEPQSD